MIPNTNIIKEWIEQSPHKPWCEQASDNIYSSGGSCSCGRDEALKNVNTLSALEYLIDSAAGSLPDNWEINIEVQQGYGEVIVTRPDGNQVHMNEDDTTIIQQFANALRLVHDELEMDKNEPQ